MTKQERAERFAKMAPPLSEEELKKINGIFPVYIFRKLKTGELWTSCCNRYEKLPPATRVEMAENVWEVMTANHQREPKSRWENMPVEHVECPFCGKQGVVKELGRTGGRENLTRWRRVVVLRWYWDTPDLSGQYFWKNKTFRYIATRLAAAPVTGVQIFAQVRGIWQKIFDAGEKARFFDWSYINFAKFVFSADRTPRTVGGKIKLKKVDKVRFRFLNEEYNEPFGLYAVGFEFTEPGGRYKG